MLCVDNHLDEATTEQEWRELLPQAFVEQFAAERSDAETEEWLAHWRRLPPDRQAEEEASQPWALSDWLYWFKPELRQWFWWDWTQTDEQTARVALEVLSWPFPWDSFAWLMRACGATDVQEEDATS